MFNVIEDRKLPFIMQKQSLCNYYCYNRSCIVYVNIKFANFNLISLKTSVGTVENMHDS